MKLKILSLIALSVLTLSGRDIQVNATRHLSANVDGAVYFPTYSTNGQSILFTQSGFSGLWIMDRSSFMVKEITLDAGAGFEHRSLPDGSIIYRSDEYRNGRKYTRFFRSIDGYSSPLTPAERVVSPARIADNRLIYLADKQLQALHLLSEEKEAAPSSLVAVFNNELNLNIYSDGHFHEAQPLGEGNYIGAELSPAQDRIVFARTGDGSYVCDLNGQILAKLGTARAPHWSPDGRYIAYMVDQDDGKQFTASDIWICTADGSQVWQITNTSDRIELYPRWSPQGNALCYHTPEGELFETTFEIVE